jgi:glucosyl-3-phosphoglycerate synthase
VLVVDAASRDGTAAAAAARGVRVAQESELMPDLGPALGKGDAMWRALSATDGEIVCYLDADTADFGPRFPLGMLGPLIAHPELQLVKGAFRRPLRIGGAVLPDGGGRVTELTARPLLNLVAPDLGGFDQPLAGETAARRDLLESLSFPVGYGVETALLIDALAACGLDALAQVDLGSRLNRHQPLRELSAMALAVLYAGLRRGLPEGALDALAPGRMLLAAPAEGEPETRDVPIAERPPMREARAAVLA